MALVITRREMESFEIGDDIKITIVRVNNGQAKISIEAPRDKNIVRSEIKNKPRKDGNFIPKDGPDIQGNR